MVTRRGAHCLVSICYLIASTHYSSVLLFLSVVACHSLKRTQSIPVREINLIAYSPLVQPTENQPNLDLNPGHCSHRPFRHCGSESALPHWATETSILFILLWTVFTMQHVMQCTVLLSQFCPSVRLSVRCMYCDKTKWCTADILVPHQTAITVDFWRQRWLVGNAPFPVKYSPKVTHPLRKMLTSTYFCL